MKFFYLHVQHGKVNLNGSPHYGQIHFEITMRKGIPHLIGYHPRYLGVFIGKMSTVFLDIVGCLPNYFKIADHCVLGTVILNKS